MAQVDAILAAVPDLQHYGGQAILALYPDSQAILALYPDAILVAFYGGAEEEDVCVYGLVMLPGHKYVSYIFVNNKEELVEVSYEE
jgi:hypothetical protein